MRKDWIKLLQVSIIGATISVNAPGVFAEEEMQVDPTQQTYVSQMAKFPELQKEFQKEVAANAHPRLAPAESENILLWQLEDYKMLNAEFADVYTQNVAPNEVPATYEEVYLWQMKEYKE